MENTWKSIQQGTYIFMIPIPSSLYSNFTILIRPTLIILLLINTAAFPPANYWLLLYFLSFFIFFFALSLNWSIVDLQHCVSLRYTTKWFLFICVLQILFHYRLLQDIEYRPLHYIVGPCCFSIFCIVVCIY